MTLSARGSSRTVCLFDHIYYRSDPSDIILYVLHETQTIKDNLRYALYITTELKLIRYT